MVYLLELKETLKKIYNKYDTYIVPAVKFLVAFVSFLMLNASIGYMARLKNPLIALLISVICAFLPNGFTIFVLSVFMLAHLYAISAEFALVALCVVLVMYLLYFRFTPKKGYLLLITVFCCWFKMPYLIPIAAGLSAGVFAVIPVSFGVVIYYIIRTASEYEAAIANESVTDAMQQISYIMESFVNNKDWIVLVIAFAVTIAVVYFIRRLTVDNAWTYAILAGTVTQFLILIIGIVAFDANINLVFMIIGTLLGALAGYLCQVLLFSVDYKRTEYVQYEDDEYYYYVKAVPKINIVNEDLKVKQINARKTRKAKDIKEIRKAAQDKQAATIEQDDDDILFFDK